MPRLRCLEEIFTAQVKREVETGGLDKLQKVLGIFDENLQTIAKELGLFAFVEGTKIVLTGEEKQADVGEKTVLSLLSVLASGEEIDKSTLLYCISLAQEGKTSELEGVMKGAVAITSRGKPVKCKTVGQKQYVSAIKGNTITFGVGPAGTGKTYLAVCLAVAAFKGKEIEKIILTRPAVEAGEKLGFLPGDLQSKVDPYLRPLYDALFDMLGAENFQKHQERGDIEVAPLAYMRGRTLDDSFIILDEAQNTTAEQMKMFLTRLGFNSKMVVTGDVTQIDLPDGKRSGLKEAVRILKNIEDIGTVRFTEKDVVRHRLVQDIIKAYEKQDEERKKK